jgi:hypothetical protein
MNRKFAWLVTPLLLACIHLAEAQAEESPSGRIPRYCLPFHYLGPH